MNICNARIGKKYIINKVNESVKLKRRLAELGLYEGGEITLLRKSILGKTFLFNLQGIAVALRKSILNSIEVSECNE